jgi:hypothetical protein
MRVSTKQLEEKSGTHQQSLMRFLPVALTVLAGGICYALFYNRSAWLSVIGYSVSPAERLLQGEVPYRDFLYNYTPGILWLNAGLMRWFGVSLMTIHAGLYAFKLAALMALYFVAKRLVGVWVALVPVALALSWIGYKYIFGVFPTQYSMVFVLLAITSMLKYDESEKLKWLFFSGASIGAVFLFKYNVGILLLACGTTVVLLRQLTTSNATLTQRLWTAIKIPTIYWIGFAIAVVPMVIYLMQNQALGAMVNHFLHHVSAYSGERAVALPPMKWLLPVFGGLMVTVFGAYMVVRRAPRFFNLYLTMIFVLAAITILIPGRAFIVKNSAMATIAYLPLLLFVVIAIGLGLSYWFLIASWKASGKETLLNKKREWWSFNRCVVIVSWFALGTYLEIYPRADYYHVVRALPPTFLLMTLLFAKAIPVLQDVFQGQSAYLNRAAHGCVAMAIALLMLVGIQNTWLPNFDSQFRFIDREALATERAQGIRVPPKQAEFIEDLTALIQNHSASEEMIFSFGQRGAGFYFLANRRNPTKFVWWRNVGIPKADRELVLGMVYEKRAKLILLQDSLKDVRVRDAVTANYHPVGQVSGIVVYERNP